MKNCQFKFRAWDSEESFMYSWEAMKENNDLEYYFDGPCNLHIMQFTGFYDRLGKEIYFDDIVNYAFDDGQGGTDSGLAVIRKSMSNGAAIRHDGIIEDIWDDDEMWALNIIGNIYEDPELGDEIMNDIN